MILIAFRHGLRASEVCGLSLNLAPCTCAEPKAGPPAPTHCWVMNSEHCGPWNARPSRPSSSCLSMAQRSGGPYVDIRPFTER